MAFCIVCACESALFVCLFGRPFDLFVRLFVRSFTRFCSLRDVMCYL